VIQPAVFRASGAIVDRFRLGDCFAVLENTDLINVDFWDNGGPASARGLRAL